ncbi:MAG TPA: DNA methyltransferase [Pirellulales bacterium]|nr:DNA methyltransferase [Pirellulales bacterium]
MKLKHAILALLGREELKRIVDEFDLDGVDRRSVEDMRRGLSRARRATPAILLEYLGETEVKAVCEAVDVDSVGRRGQLIERLLAGTDAAETETAGPAEADPVKGKDALWPDEGTDTNPKRQRGGQTDPQRQRGGRASARPGTERTSQTSAGSGSAGPAAKRAIEHYEHSDKTRMNNPPVGLVTPQTDPDAGTKKRYAYDPHLDPTLVWAGKAEQSAIEVPTVSLHVHERIDPRTIIEAVRRRNGGAAKAGGAPVQRSLFEEPEENPPLREAIDFYRHAHGWSNRLIAGNSLLVMNSLLEKEGLAGKVQMIYIDPPYGIKYGSNFQPFVNRRDVKDGSDDDLTQEPEMVQAFRDTWELGIHSYLTYLRDRLLLCRDLLTATGSIFVQISDQNLHHVRELVTEILGADNFVCTIAFKKTGAMASARLPVVCDYIIWAAKDGCQMQFQQLFMKRSSVDGGLDAFKHVLLPSGEVVGAVEFSDGAHLPDGAKACQSVSLTSQDPSETRNYTYLFRGREFKPPANRHWSISENAMRRLEQKRRLFVAGDSLRFAYLLEDNPVVPINNIWADTGTGSFTEPQRYVVETASKAVVRCMLMTTNPGDLVFDPTCGSGTTAAVAERWGRRWITCDTSRVATAITKQRLMTQTFPYYELAHPNEGIPSGFVYKTVPRITLGEIANDEPPSQETLFDQPDVDKSKVRVTGPFTVEAVPAPAVRPISEIVKEEQAAVLDEQPSLPGIEPLDGQTRLELRDEVAVARYGETARQREWRDELLKCGIRGRSGQRVEFARIEPLGGTRWLQCEGETKGDSPEHVVVSFGPEYAPLEQRQVESALEEAGRLKPRPALVVFAAFQFDPEAAKDIDETRWPGVTLLKVQMNTDLLTDDLKKKRASNESYWLVGQPDVAVTRLAEGAYRGLWQVEVYGFDYYNPRSGQIESGDTSKIAMWLLDTDYDGRSLFPRQVFFPMAGDKEGWSRLARNLKAEIDEERIEAYRGSVSLPFEAGEHRRVAVKIVDDRGIESLKIVELNG